MKQTATPEKVVLCATIEVGTRFYAVKVYAPIRREAIGLIREHLGVAPGDMYPLRKIEGVRQTYKAFNRPDLTVVVEPWEKYHDARFPNAKVLR